MNTKQSVLELLASQRKLFRLMQHDELFGNNDTLDLLGGNVEYYSKDVARDVDSDLYVNFEMDGMKSTMKEHCSNNKDHDTMEKDRRGLNGLNKRSGTEWNKRSGSERSGNERSTQRTRQVDKSHANNDKQREVRKREKSGIRRRNKRRASKVVSQNLRLVKTSRKEKKQSLRVGKREKSKLDVIQINRGRNNLNSGSEDGIMDFVSRENQRNRTESVDKLSTAGNMSDPESDASVDGESSEYRHENEFKLENGNHAFMDELENNKNGAFHEFQKYKDELFSARLRKSIDQSTVQSPKTSLNGKFVEHSYHSEGKRQRLKREKSIRRKSMGSTGLLTSRKSIGQSFGILGIRKHSHPYLESKSVKARKMVNERLLKRPKSAMSRPKSAISRSKTPSPNIFRKETPIISRNGSHRFYTPTGDSVLKRERSSSINMKKYDSINQNDMYFPDVNNYKLTKSKTPPPPQKISTNPQDNIISKRFSYTPSPTKKTVLSNSNSQKRRKSDSNPVLYPGKRARLSPVHDKSNVKKPSENLEIVSTKESFQRMKVRLLNLWNEMNVPIERRRFIVNNYLSNPSVDNANAIAAEILTLMTQRKRIFKVMKEITTRETLIDELKFMVQKHLRIKYNEYISVANKLEKLIQKIQEFSERITKAIIIWRESLDVYHEKPFIWQDQDYSIKMETDLDFFYSSALADLVVNSGQKKKPRSPMNVSKSSKLSPIKKRFSPRVSNNQSLQTQMFVNQSLPKVDVHSNEELNEEFPNRSINSILQRNNLSSSNLSIIPEDSQQMSLPEISPTDEKNLQIHENNDTYPESPLPRTESITSLSPEEETTSPSLSFPRTESKSLLNISLDHSENIRSLQSCGLSPQQKQSIEAILSLVDRDEQAMKIQCMFRVWKAKKTIKEIKKQNHLHEIEEMQNQAVLQLQKQIRGAMARKKAAMKENMFIVLQSIIRKNLDSTRMTILIQQINDIQNQVRERNKIYQQCLDGLYTIMLDQEELLSRLQHKEATLIAMEKQHHDAALIIQEWFRGCQSIKKCKLLLQTMKLQQEEDLKLELLNERKIYIEKIRLNSAARIIQREWKQYQNALLQSRFHMNQDAELLVFVQSRIRTIVFQLQNQLATCIQSLFRAHCDRKMFGNPNKSIVFCHFSNLRYVAQCIQNGIRTKISMSVYSSDRDSIIQTQSIIRIFLSEQNVKLRRKELHDQHLFAIVLQKQSRMICAYEETFAQKSCVVLVQSLLRERMVSCNLYLRRIEMKVKNQLFSQESSLCSNQEFIKTEMKDEIETPDERDQYDMETPSDEVDSCVLCQSTIRMNLVQSIDQQMQETTKELQDHAETIMGAPIEDQQRSKTKSQTKIKREKTKKHDCTIS